MRVRIAPGVEFESLSADETRRIVRDETRAGSGRPEHPVTIRAEENFAADANGNVGVQNDAIVYRVPAGMEFRVHRVRVGVDGNQNQGTPLQHANAYYQLRAGDRVLDDVCLDAAKSFALAIPLVRTDGFQQSAVALNGESVNIVLGGLALAAGTNVTVFVQGTLLPKREAAPPE